jgi:glycosyltransferase involved in cell wall biosynthesis
MKILCLTDFIVPEGTRWLWDDLPENDDEVVFMHIQSEDRSEKWGKLLSYYPRLIGLGWRALRLAKGEKFDLIAAWEGKNGFPIALLRRLTNQLEPPLLIFAFSVRGPIRHFDWLPKFGVQGADYLTVPTKFEKYYYTKRLNFPAEQIICCPIGVYDVQDDSNQEQYGNFIFSGGRSGRDYETLLRAIDGLDIHLIINARPFNLKGLSLPSNVQVNDILPIKEYRKLNNHARFVVLPLKPVNEAVGLTGVLYAMAAGKAVIASSISGLDEYVYHGETGLLVQPDDPGELSKAIMYLWDHPDISLQMGIKARELFEQRYTFTAMAKRSHEIMRTIVTRETVSNS